MTEPTIGCAARPAIATSSTDRSRFSAYAVNASTRSQSAFVSQPARSGSALGPRAGRRRLAAVVLAGEQATLEREVGQHPDAVGLAGRDHVVLERAVEQGVVVLDRHEALQAGRARGPVGVRELPRVEVGAAEVAHLALPDQVGQGRQRLLDRGDVARHVQLVEVEVVGLQPPQARLHGPDDVAAARPGSVVAGRAALPELGGQHELVALPLERGADQLLGPAERVAVGVGGVEEGDAGVTRGGKDVGHAVGVDSPGEGVAPDADRAHHQARVAQRAVGASSRRRPTRRPAASIRSRSRSVKRRCHHSSSGTTRRASSTVYSGWFRRPALRRERGPRRRHARGIGIAEVGGQRVDALGPRRQHLVERRVRVAVDARVDLGQLPGASQAPGRPIAG